MRDLIRLISRFVGTLLFGVLAWMTQVSPEEVIPRLSKWWALVFGSTPTWMTEPHVKTLVVILSGALALGFLAWFVKLLLTNSKAKTAAEILYPKQTLTRKLKDWLAKKFPTVYKKRRLDFTRFCRHSSASGL